MQGSMAVRNEAKAMAVQQPTEFIYNVAVTGANEPVCTDSTLYSVHFQKMFIYPASAADPDNIGRLLPNTNPIWVGKSGAVNLGALSSLTANGSVAHAVRLLGHGLLPGAAVTIVGATPAAYNGTFRIFNVTATTFDFQLKQDPLGPASVLGLYTRPSYLPDVLQVNDLPIKYELPWGLKMKVSDIIVQGTAGDGVFIQCW